MATRRHKEEVHSFHKQYNDRKPKFRKISEGRAGGRWTQDEMLFTEPISTVAALLRGKLDLEELPKIKSRVVRLFVSSTFTDLVNERNWLMVNVYPKLKAYCRERYGIDFQAVDMRWGVPQHAIDDHSVTDLCVREIQNCKEDSIGPNFVVLLGQKYGFVPLPSELSQNDYEAIYNALQEEGEDLTLLHSWYEKDTNAVPNAYVLHPISVLLGADTDKWTAIKDRLHGLLVRGADICLSKETVSAELVESLQYSVTEHEVKEGIRNVKNQDLRNRNCLCIIRTIEDIHDCLDKERIRRFLDFEQTSPTINEQSYAAINKLRNEVGVKRLLAASMFQNTVKWSGQKGIEATVHASYLEDMGKNFSKRVLELIDQNVKRAESFKTDQRYEEILQHWTLAKQRVGNFVGRDDLLGKIAEYICDDTEQPLVLHGLSGYGKTSIMAKAASLAKSWVQRNGSAINTTVMLRFCGTSAGSSNIRQLLLSLCHQLAHVASTKESQLPKDYKDIKLFFLDMLQQGDINGLLIIFLDGVNQLPDHDNAHRLDWLPAKISNNVKIIVSTVSDAAVFSRLQSKITNKRYFVEVLRIPPTLSSDILSLWLRKHNRILNTEQWPVVRQALNGCGSPLYTQLIFADVRLWKSYHQVNVDSLSKCVQSCIHRLFDKIEEKYGKQLVQHALAYITASKTGISESEMEDILSLDDEVLNSVFVFWEPPIRRIPTMLWPRIRQAISGYLMEREHDETRVLYWYHQQFIEVAHARYLSDIDMKLYIHDVMSDYFLGTWSGTKKKPFKYLADMQERLKLKETNAEAIRYVAEQPLFYSTFNTSYRYNYRKLSQLPYHLLQARRYKDLNNHVFFNFQWLLNKMEAYGVQQVISDFNLMKSDREVNLVADTLRMAELVLSEDQGVLAVEMSGRLLPHYGKYDNIRKLLDQCDAAALTYCPLVPNWQVYTSPGGPLQYVCEIEGTEHCDLDITLITPDNTAYLVAKPFYGTEMRIWDVIEGELQPDLVLPAGSLIYPSPDGKFIHLIKNNRHLQTFRFDSGDLYGEVDFGYGTIRSVTVSNRYVSLILTGVPGPTIIDTYAKMILHRFLYQTDTVAISLDDSYLACNMGKVIALHDLPLLDRKCLIEIADVPTKIIFSKDPTRLYVMLKNNELHSVVVNLKQRRGKTSGIVSDMQMKDFRLSFSHKKLLVRCSRCLFLMDAINEKLLHRIQQMPAGIFVEKMSVFKDAAFSPNDALVVACRHTYIGVWDASTGHPLRLLQSSVSPILKLFTSDIVNKVITVVNDNAIQVWDLDNLDADVQHLNTVIRGSIGNVNVSSKGHRAICCATTGSEAAVLDLNTGQCEHLLLHNDDVFQKLDDVLVSPLGNYGVTRAATTDIPDYLEPWPLLREDKLWNLQTGKLMHCITSSRFVAFSDIDNRVVFFSARSYSTYDWSVNTYDAVAVDLITNETQIFDLPYGEIIGEPILVCGGDLLVFILQQNVKGKNAENTVLVVNSFDKRWKGHKLLDLHTLSEDIKTGSCFLDIKHRGENEVLIIYGKGVTNLSHNSDGSIDRSKRMVKGALLYNMAEECLKRHYNDFLFPNSDIDKMLVSRERSLIIDNDNRIYSITMERCIGQLSFDESIVTDTTRLLMGGRYVAVISGTRREIFIYRTIDSCRKGGIFVHGLAKSLAIGADDRTLLVGCADGRIMIFTVILETSDPVREIIKQLPSRNTRNDSLVRDTSVLEYDVQQIKNSGNKDKHRFSITREYIKKTRNSVPTFKSVGRAVAVTKKVTSKACSIQ